MYFVGLLFNTFEGSIERPLPDTKEKIQAKANIEIFKKNAGVFITDSSGNRSGYGWLDKKNGKIIGLSDSDLIQNTIIIEPQNEVLKEKQSGAIKIREIIYKKKYEYFFTYKCSLDNSENISETTEDIITEMNNQYLSIKNKAENNTKYQIVDYTTYKQLLKGQEPKNINNNPNNETKSSYFGFGIGDFSKDFSKDFSNDSKITSEIIIDGVKKFLVSLTL